MIPLDRNLLITGTSISLIALSFAVLKSFKVKRRRKQKKSIVWRALSREIGYRQTMVPCLNGLGYVYFALGQHKKAIKYHTQALAFAREINNRKEESISLGSLGRAYHYLNQYHKAIACYRQAQAFTREIGDQQREGDHLGDLGNTYRSLGEYDRARENLEQSIVVLEEIKSPNAEKMRKKLVEMEAR